ncbi:13101_t:CDS:2, partial [Racocetra persica]
VFNTSANLVNDIFNSLYCLDKIEVLDAKWAERYAINSWFVCICLAIIETSFKICKTKKNIEEANSEANLEELERYRQKLYWLKVRLAKILMDFLFCGYDFFGYTCSDGVQAVSGFLAGIL